MRSDKAFEKWCPFSRTTMTNVQKNGTWNRLVQTDGDYPYIPQAACCIGDKCAVWVWMDEACTDGRCGMMDGHGFPQ